MICKPGNCGLLLIVLEDRLQRGFARTDDTQHEKSVDVMPQFCAEFEERERSPVVVGCGCKKR